MNSLLKHPLLLQPIIRALLVLVLACIIGYVPAGWVAEHGGVSYAWLLRLLTACIAGSVIFAIVTFPFFSLQLLGNSRKYLSLGKPLFFFMAATCLASLSFIFFSDDPNPLVALWAEAGGVTLQVFGTWLAFRLVQDMKVIPAATGRTVAVCDGTIRRM